MLSNIQHRPEEIQVRRSGSSDNENQSAKKIDIISKDQNQEEFEGKRVKLSCEKPQNIQQDLPYNEV